MIGQGVLVSPNSFGLDGSVIKMGHYLLGFQEVHGMNHEPYEQT